MAEREKNIMIIDGGSRGQAIAKNLRELSPEVGEITLVPGNAGTNFIDGASNLKLNTSNHKEVATASKDLKTQLVIIAPEEPLVNGIVDDLTNEGINTFGPKKDAARLEGSKAFSSQKLNEWGVPIPEFHISTDIQEAHKFITDSPSWAKFGLVVKADGLAAGKGVFVTKSAEEAHHAVDQLMKKKIFGISGEKIVFQEKLSGFEVSAMAIVDGEKWSLLPTSEDHKQIYNDDIGPNTGGMGGVAPHPLIDKQKVRQINSQVIEPIIKGLKKDKTPFHGILYPALFWTKDGPKVIEVNCRFGGSEWEALSRLINFNTYNVFSDAAKGRLNPNEVRCNSGSAVSVALVSKGYPGSYEKGKTIHGLDKSYTAEVLHAGTKKEGDDIVTNGGRVIFVTASGGNIYEAREHAYRAIGDNGVNFQGMHYRQDVGIRKRNE